LPRAMLDR